MVAAMVVMLDERLDLGLKITGQEVVLQQDAILEGLVPACREMRIARFPDGPGGQSFRQIMDLRY